MKRDNTNEVRIFIPTPMKIKFQQMLTGITFMSTRIIELINFDVKYREQNGEIADLERILTQQKKEKAVSTSTLFAAKASSWHQYLEHNLDKIEEIHCLVDVDTLLAGRRPSVQEILRIAYVLGDAEADIVTLIKSSEKSQDDSSSSMMNVVTENETKNENEQHTTIRDFA